MLTVAPARRRSPKQSPWPFIWRWIGTALCSESWTHSVLVDCITNMSGFDLRRAQPANSIYKDMGWIKGVIAD
jgi:hypothetical protein